MRKGQAAMEFLMTYGWAILVVLAAIGALAYFGVLSPDRFLPDKCTANPPFSCGEYKASQSATDKLSLTIKNNAGVDMTIYDVKVSCDSGTSTANATSWTANSLVYNDNSFQANFTSGAMTTANCGTITEGKKFKATYTITYVKSGETTTHTGSGSVQARVEA